MRQSISVSMVNGLLEFAVSKGAKRDKLLTKSGIREEQLTNPDNRLPLKNYRTLMHTAKLMTNNPALALHYGEEVGMPELSIVGLIMESSGTMGEAFLQMQRYGRLVAETDEYSAAPTFDLKEDTGRLFMLDTREFSYTYPELTEEAFSRLCCGPRRFLSQPHILSVHLRYETPEYSSEYERIFECPVHFEAKWNALELHPEIATWKVAQNPDYILKILTQHADKLLDRLNAERTFSGKVERIILEALHHGDISSDTVAEKLQMSRQSLFRKLKEDGTTFTDLLEKLRLRLAKEYLIAQKISVNETAYLLGFADPAAFSRAFKRWTGMPPKQFRDRISNT